MTGVRRHGPAGRAGHGGEGRFAWSGADWLRGTSWTGVAAQEATDLDRGAIGPAPGPEEGARTPGLPFGCPPMAPDGAAGATVDEARAMASVWRRYAEEATRAEDRADRLGWTERWDRYRVPRQATDLPARSVCARSRRGVKGPA